jgi:CO/xanthine dehydrogenase FAD-binding subunit
MIDFYETSPLLGKFLLPTDVSEDALPMKEYIFSPTVDYALHILEKENVMIIGGGTSLIQRRKRIRNSILLDITRMGLSGIRYRANETRIGATTKIADLLQEEQLVDYAGGLLQIAARKVGSPALRNQITVGGNILAGFSWSDMTSALLALDAQLLFRDSKGEHQRHLEEYLKTPSIFVKGKMLLTAILIPAKLDNFRAFHRKFQESASSLSLLTISGTSKVVGKSLTDCRIALSGCTRQPLRLSTLERALETITPTRENLLPLIKLQIAEIPLVQQMKMSRDYAKELVIELLAENIENWIEVK